MLRKLMVWVLQVVLRVQLHLLCLHLLNMQLLRVHLLRVQLLRVHLLRVQLLRMKLLRVQVLRVHQLRLLMLRLLREHAQGRKHERGSLHHGHVVGVATQGGQQTALPVTHRRRARVQAERLQDVCSKGEKVPLHRECEHGKLDVRHHGGRVRREQLPERGHYLRRRRQRRRAHEHECGEKRVAWRVGRSNVVQQIGQLRSRRGARGKSQHQRERQPRRHAAGNLVGENVQHRHAVMVRQPAVGKRVQKVILILLRHPAAAPSHRPLTPRTLSAFIVVVAPLGRQVGGGPAVHIHGVAFRRSRSRGAGGCGRISGGGSTLAFLLH